MFDAEQRAFSPRQYVSIAAVILHPRSYTLVAIALWKLAYFVPIFIVYVCIMPPCGSIIYLFILFYLS